MEDEHRRRHTHLRTLLSMIVRAGFVADAAAHPPWRQAALRSLDDLRTIGLAPISSELGSHLDGIWTLAVQDAQSDPIVRGEETVQPRLQRASLFSLEDLLAPGFDFDRAAERVTRSASTG